ncbi:MAG: hypothetical protein QXS02_02925 [Candidatus Thermoplasmatota archaeon]
MWLITTLSAAVICSVLWILTSKKYRLDLLSLMLWGSTIMILVDHILGYDGEEFVTMETEGVITNSITLGVLMLIPIILVWLIILFIDKKNKNIARGE